MGASTRSTVKNSSPVGVVEAADMQKKEGTAVGRIRCGPLGGRGWRRRTLPQGLPCSTIRAARLNGRVRDGNGCGPRAVTTSQFCVRTAPMLPAIRTVYSGRERSMPLASPDASDRASSRSSGGRPEPGRGDQACVPTSCVVLMFLLGVRAHSVHTRGHTGCPLHVVLTRSGSLHSEPVGGDGLRSSLTGN